MPTPDSSRIVPRVFILDVDGVMTTGQFFYTAEGKAMKVFGPDDHDGLSLLKPYLEIRFVTGDAKGFDISRRRIVADMKFQLDLVSTVKRLAWIAEHYDPRTVIYMGDGIFDHYVMRAVGYAIAPANADRNAKESANYVTERLGGDRAVAEASLHILETFFEAYDPEQAMRSDISYSSSWGA
ncbi:MAG: HAD hydrolase family protein [Alphaproteobacteria bacterium]|nr:HAD hydrolase family protein [Alphaproteobacteria bacterium]